MTNLDMLRRSIDLTKKIELIVIHSDDEDLKNLYFAVLSAKSKSEIREVLLEHIVNLTLSKLLKQKSSRIKERINPLISLSEKILKNINKMLHNYPYQKAINYRPIDFFLPPEISTVIFHRKLFMVFSKPTKEFLELLLNEAITPEDFIASLTIATYYEHLGKKHGEKITRYFLRTRDFKKTLIITVALFRIRESTVKIKIKTIKPYFKNKYLAGYTTDELPIGTILIVKEKRGPYYYAKKQDEALGKTYILHKDEVEVVEKQEIKNTKTIENAKNIIKQILHETDQ